MFLTDVRTPCLQIWENNPDITPLDEFGEDTEVIACHHPLIHRCNFAPVYFVQGFIERLNAVLDLRARRIAAPPARPPRPARRREDVRPSRDPL